MSWLWCSLTQGEELLKTEDILSVIEEQGDSIALVMFSGEWTEIIIKKTDESLSNFSTIQTE